MFLQDCECRAGTLHQRNVVCAARGRLETQDTAAGEQVIFSFAGEARATYPGLDGQPFFKVVRGLPGDVVTVSGTTVPSTCSARTSPLLR